MPLKMRLRPFCGPRAAARLKDKDQLVKEYGLGPSTPDRDFLQRRQDSQCVIVRVLDHSKEGKETFQTSLKVAFEKLDESFGSRYGGESEVDGGTDSANAAEN